VRELARKANLSSRPRATLSASDSDIAINPLPVPTRGEESALELAYSLYENAERTWRSLRWLGVPVRKLPFDLWMLQEIVFDTRPELVIETGTDLGGSALFFATLFDLIGAGEVISVDVDHQKVAEAARRHPRVTLIGGNSTEPRVSEQLREAATDRRTMVTLDSDHRAAHVAEELRLLSPLVSPGCYLIVEDTVLDTIKIESDFGPGPGEALREWLLSEPPFKQDPSRERLTVSFNPGGYLRRTGGEEGAPQREPALSPHFETPGDASGERQSLRDELLAQRRVIEATDLELRSLRNEASTWRELVELRGKRIDELEGRIAPLHLVEQEAQIAALQNEVVELTVRLARIQASLPGRIWTGLRRIPPLSWLAARRARAYWDELDDRQG
jgi:cephalosporin hydroxylase